MRVTKKPGPLHAAPNPCSSCPYARTTPSGVWGAAEYEKLRGYDRDYPPETALFLCHQSNATGVETVCKGWLSVHRDSVAVRVAQIRGEVTGEQVAHETTVPLYGSGNEAADAGEAAIEEPDEKAKRMVARLLKKGAGS